MGAITEQENVGKVGTSPVTLASRTLRYVWTPSFWISKSVSGDGYYQNDLIPQQGARRLIHWFLAKWQPKYLSVEDFLPDHL